MSLIRALDCIEGKWGLNFLYRKGIVSLLPIYVVSPGLICCVCYFFFPFIYLFMFDSLAPNVTFFFFYLNFIIIIIIILKFEE